MGKAKERGPSGLVVIDKPAGMTSHDVVSKLRWVVGTRRVGHAGTLDPAATGVLVVGLNKATKLLTYLVGQDKTYTASIRLGAETLTEDAEGPLTSIAPAGAVNSLSRESIEAAMRELTGSIMQVPSRVSAIKVGGVASYARVRAGEDIELEPRPVTVSEFVLMGVRAGALPRQQYTAADGVTIPDSATVLELEVRVSCSSGTYVRALARDLGRLLGVGAHLCALRRTRVGTITLSDAANLDELLAARELAGEPLADTLPVVELGDAARRLFTVRELSAREATDISFGRRISPVSRPEKPGPCGTGAHTATPVLIEGIPAGPARLRHPGTDGITAAFAPNGVLVGLLEQKKFRGTLYAAPVLVFESGVDFTHLEGA